MKRKTHLVINQCVRSSDTVKRRVARITFRIFLATLRFTVPLECLYLKNEPILNFDIVMEQNFKFMLYAVGAMILAPQTLRAQSVNIEGLDSLRLSGSISVVEPEVLKKGVLNNALDALSGQTAGVNVTTNGLDRIAMLNSVRVRGTTSIMGGNDPLVIIDGVTSDVATLATIYPADIESFTVLKNASETALYGSRGASGVIQVKTKKGTGK